MNKYRRDFFYSTNYKLEFEIANYEADDIGLETFPLAFFFGQNVHCRPCTRILYKRIKEV